MDHRFNISPAFWGGNIINNELWGKNQMGKYLMHIRELI